MKHSPINYSTPVFPLLPPPPLLLLLAAYSSTDTFRILITFHWQF